MVHDEPLREKGSNTSQRSPSRRDPGSGGKPGSTPEGAREGRREAGRPCQESRPLQTSTAMHRVVSEASPQAANSFAVARRQALRWLRLWPGYGEQTRAQWCLRPQTVGSDTRSISAGAAEQISAGPAAHQRLPGKENCREPRRATVGAQSCGSHSGAAPSSRWRCQAGGRPPRSHLSPLLLLPASETCWAGFQGLPLTSPHPRKHAVGSLQTGHRRASFRDGDETLGVSAEMGPERASPLRESHSFRLRVDAGTEPSTRPGAALDDGTDWSPLSSHLGNLGKGINRATNPPPKSVSRSCAMKTRSRQGSRGWLGWHTGISVPPQPRRARPKPSTLGKEQPQRCRPTLFSFHYNKSAFSFTSNRL